MVLLREAQYFLSEAERWCKRKWYFIIKCHDYIFITYRSSFVNVWYEFKRFKQSSLRYSKSNTGTQGRQIEYQIKRKELLSLKYFILDELFLGIVYSLYLSVTYHSKNNLAKNTKVIHYWTHNNGNKHVAKCLDDIIHNKTKATKDTISESYSLFFHFPSFLTSLMLVRSSCSRHSFCRVINLSKHYT